MTLKKKQILITLIILLITITGCSQQEYEVNIEVAPENSGQVVGEGTYVVGEEVNLVALPNEEYKFKNWTIDGEVIYEDNIHKMTVDKNLVLTANFDRIRRNKFAYVNINDGLDVRIGPFYEGEKISLKAETIEGYEFLNWEIDGEKFSEEKKIEFNIDKRDIKVKANYTNIAKEIDELIERADEEILNRNYDKAQEYLKDAIRDENIKKSKYYNNSSFLLNLSYASDPLKRIESFKDNIMTPKDYTENLEKYEDIKPEAPKIKIFERDEKEIYTWFKKCLNYKSSIKGIPYDKNFAEIEVDNLIKEEESKFFEHPEGMPMFFSKMRLINSEIYGIKIGTGGAGMLTKPFVLLEKLDLKEIDVSQDRVIISIERPSEDTLISLYNDDGSPYIESCDIVFEINEYEDGSFKIKDYYIENMITFEE
jgi:hypothetical protein